MADFMLKMRYFALKIEFYLVHRLLVCFI